MVKLQSTYSSQDFDERVRWQENVFLDINHASFGLLTGYEVDDVLNLLVNEDRECAVVTKSLYEDIYPELSQYMQDKGFYVTEAEGSYIFARSAETAEKLIASYSMQGEEAQRLRGELFGYPQEKIDHFIDNYKYEHFLDGRLQKDIQEYKEKHDTDYAPRSAFFEAVEQNQLRGEDFTGVQTSHYPSCTIPSPAETVESHGRVEPSKLNCLEK